MALELHTSYTSTKLLEQSTDVVSLKIIKFLIDLETNLLDIYYVEGINNNDGEVIYTYDDIKYIGINQTEFENVISNFTNTYIMMKSTLYQVLKDTLNITGDII